VEVTTKALTAWVATRRDDLFIIAEQSMSKKVFVEDLETHELSIITRGKKTVLGELLRVDMSPEALLEDLDIQEGQRLLLLPAGFAGGRQVN